MKFRFSSGITLASGQYEPALKLHLVFVEVGGREPHVVLHVKEH